jgi:uncharacterized membrane protein
VYYSSALILRRAFGAAAIAWAVALPLATWITSGTTNGPHASWPLAALALAIYKVGGFICHQLPERSFQLWAAQMPVCARCTGIYAGGALATLASALTGRRSRCLAAGRTALIVAAIPTLATYLLEWMTGETPGGWIRALAGAPLGAVVAWVIVRGEA